MKKLSKPTLFHYRTIAICDICNWKRTSQLTHCFLTNFCVFFFLKGWISERMRKKCNKNIQKLVRTLSILRDLITEFQGKSGLRQLITLERCLLDLIVVAGVVIRQSTVHWSVTCWGAAPRYFHSIYLPVQTARICGDYLSMYSPSSKHGRLGFLPYN